MYIDYADNSKCSPKFSFDSYNSGCQMDKEECSL